MTRSKCTPDKTDTPLDIRTPLAELHLRVEERIHACPYAFHFNKVSWHYAGSTLTLRGSVATFYLKQILQTKLRDIPRVKRIVNEVDVISVTGLSSERTN